MTSNKPERPTPQMRAIARSQVQQSLALAAAVAMLVSACGQNNKTADPNAVTDQNANEEIPAVFYKTTEECEADVKKQDEEYAVLKTAFEGGTLATEPTEPPIKQEDCEPQMLAAQVEHQKHAPTYASLADCQAEGLNCEPAPQTTGYYRPVFGGSYFYPYGGYYGGNNFIYYSYLGSQRRLYQPRTVYQSSTAGQVVTPNGQVVTNRGSGVVNAPRHTTAPAPTRPTGTAARGTIKGRGTQGFGSTYKSTGRGGK